MKMAAGSNTVGIIVAFLLLVIMMPFFIIKFAYLDQNSELRKTVSDRETVRLNAASVLKLMEAPDAFDKFIQGLSKKREEITGLRPKPAEMIETQKVLADLANENHIAIIAFRPVEEGVPVELEGSEQPVEEGGESKPGIVPGLKVAVIDVLITGKFADICEYLLGIENSREVTAAIAHLKMALQDSDAVDIIEAELQLKVFYSASQSGNQEMIP